MVKNWKTECFEFGRIIGEIYYLCVVYQTQVIEGEGVEYKDKR